MVCLEMGAEWWSNTTRMRPPGIVSVKLLEQRDELDAAVTLLDVGKDVAAVQVDARQD